MAKEICISSTPHETRLAILEDDQLSEIYYERENEYTLAGSIYNGRVTRVLPGMQSAFVDLGLERDAFLYVTDFLEMEDPEESDELEKAAVSAPIKPREIRRRPESAPVAAPAPEAAAIVESEAGEADAETGSEAGAGSGEEEGGARRWRGRRRRRGGRGQAAPVSDPVETEAASETYLEAPGLESSDESGEPGHSHEIQAAAGELPGESRPSSRSGSRRDSRQDSRSSSRSDSRQDSRSDSRPSSRQDSRPEPAAAAFVLPGESLSKYGGEPAPDDKPEQPTTAASVPARPTVTSRPSTLIAAPIEWDGTGLLPGESLARHRNREAEPASVEPEVKAEAAITEISETHETPAPEAAHAEPAVEIHYVIHAGSETLGQHYDERIIDEFAGESAEPIIEEISSEPATESEAAPAAESASHSSAFEFEEEEISPEDGHSASHHASHNIDPLPPSEFRLFGLGGKKKKAAEPEPTPVEAAPTTTVASVSAFAPGNGLVEEELIEEEEFATPGRHAHRNAENDLDEYEEEEKLQSRAGALSEAFKEAQLGRGLNRGLEIDEAGDEDELDSEEEGGEGTASAPAAPRERRDKGERGGRGRRGGGRNTGHAGQQNNRRGGGMSRRSAQTSDLPIISDLLKPGQEILVQIAKEPIAKKGARITSHIALPGRFLVFMPTVSHVGVSRKIESDEERQRLKRILLNERGEAAGGFIVRTAAEGTSEEELRADLRFLIHLWDEIKQRSEGSPSPALIYHDLSLIERILRDQVSDDFSSIWVDNEAAYERIVRFLNRFSPTLVRRVKLYTKETPLFEHFGIEDEISKALRSKVWLKSGGSIVINQTEALVAIDINTGKYVGKTARLEDTIVKTNLDAIPEIVRQIRLRDLGGIIIIDFIDMDERKNRFRVMAALEEALKTDRAPTKVLQFNDFGLVAITRKRVKQSLERTLSVPCPTCQATGMVKSPTTVCNEIFIELRKMRKHFENADVMLRVHPETVKVLKANNARRLTEFEELTGKNLLVKSDASLHPEQFDIQG